MTIKQQINGLLGPLEAAARQDSLEDVADIANEIARLARAGLKLEERKRSEATLKSFNEQAEQARRAMEIRRQIDAALVQSEALRPVPQAYPHGRWSTI